MIGDRGQNELIGYVLVFTLITGTISVVYAGGIGGLNDARTSEQVTNVERAFDVLAANIDDLTYMGAPSRATELRLMDGSIGVGDTTTFTVAINQSEPDNASYAVSIRPIVFRSVNRDTEMYYDNGATIRTDDGNPIMLDNPDWVVNDDRMVIPYVVLLPDSDRTAIGGSTNVLVVTELQTQKIRGSFTTDGTATVDVTVDSPRAAAWKQYFESLPYTAKPDDDASDGNVTYRFTTDAVYISQSRISVAFER